MENLTYNTQLKQLALPEYGRNIQCMVDHALTIEDREERQRCANTIINIMGNMFPHLRDINDFKHKLWDHLAIMADFKLDIDYPYSIPQPEKFKAKPAKVPYPNTKIRYHHYGKVLEMMVKRAAEYPDGEEKNVLVNLLANQMKKLYTIWNKDGVEDQKILADLCEISEGKLNYSVDEIRFWMKENINNNNNQYNNNNNKNKKKKHSK